MAGISNNSSILSMLKIWYKDGVENLMFRNSPALQKINKVRVEGKSQNFNALYGHGGAGSSDFTKALTNASTVAKDVEFAVTPGQLFSVYTMNAKEVQASVTQRGAYMKVAGAKMFAASETFRKMMAAAFYGRGYGEICASGYTTAIVANTAFDLTLPDSAIMKIDVDTQLALKSSVTSATVNTVLTVNTINGNTVNVTPTVAVAAPLATDILCYYGSMDASGNPIMPMGLGGWLPTVASRTGTNWTAYIGTTFFGVNRSIVADRLAGAFYKAASTSETYLTSVKNLMKKCRRQGSLADLIIVNDSDFATLDTELTTNNTYFTATSTKAKKNATSGFSEIAAAFSTNFVDNIVDDPYCPQGRFYVLDSKTVEFWSYTNVDKLNDGIVNNNPGKEDPMAMENEGKEKQAYGLIIDDYLNVQSGTATIDGPSTNVTLQCFGSFVVTNPSINGVGEFANSTDFEL